MPRIGRFTVEFIADGKEWLLETVHKHAREEGSGLNRRVVEPLVHRIEDGSDAGKFIKVQHLTTVKLRHKGSPTFVRGVATCSLKDPYNWRRGLHYALQRALEKAGYCRLVKDAGGKIVVTDKKPIYDEICEAFWREAMTPPAHSSAGSGGQQPGYISGPAVVAAPSGGARHVLHGMGFSEDVRRTSSPYVEAVPPENRWGLGWAGMD